MAEPTIVGRSSSHFTRVVRMFALELEVAHVFRPVFDLSSLDAVTYAGNPALKVPILVDESGPLFGTENICRALLERSRTTARVVMRGEVEDRVVANAEELTLHAMSAEVSLIVAKQHGSVLSPKVHRSLENSLRYLDDGVDAVLAALPPSRTFSFVETALFCLISHLPFRDVLDISGRERLAAFARSYGERASARATEYRFDTE